MWDHFDGTVSLLQRKLLTDTQSQQRLPPLNGAKEGCGSGRAGGQLPSARAAVRDQESHARRGCPP